MNIFKTFEIFLREPLSIIKEKLVQIVGINSSLIKDTAVTVDMVNNKHQITVVNSDKMYNLLRTVMMKKEENAARVLIEAAQKPQQQMVIGQLLKRQNL